MSDLTDKLREQITQYLATSGLFNPENGQHSNVHDLMVKCRDTLAAPLPISERANTETGRRESKNLTFRWPTRWT